MENFTGITGGLNTTTIITHGITNGRKRILSISVNVESEASAVLGVPSNAFIAGVENMQDEKSVTEEFQTYYNDNNIYLHVEGSATNVKENRYTIIVTYASADIY